VKNGFLIPGLNVQTFSIVMDQKSINDLPKEYQDEIVKLIDEIASNQWKKSIEDDKKILDELVKEGVVVKTEAPENIESLKQKFQTANDLFSKDFPQVYKQFQELINKTESGFRIHP
jgi:TRAP-type C4-dicarboxylate transport system substrate-binding protein